MTDFATGKSQNVWRFLTWTISPLFMRTAPPPRRRSLLGTLRIAVMQMPLFGRTRPLFIILIL